MTKFYDMHSRCYQAPPAYGEAEPVRQQELEEMAENDLLFRDGKAGLLPGEMAAGVSAEAAGGGFACTARVIATGDNLRIFNPKAFESGYGYDGLFPTSLTDNDGDGLKHRFINLRWSANLTAMELEAQAMMPGQSIAFYLLGAGDGGPWLEHGFYAGGGGLGGNHQFTFQFAGGETLTFYVCDTPIDPTDVPGELRITYDSHGSDNDWCALFALIEFTGRLEA